MRGGQSDAKVVLQMQAMALVPGRFTSLDRVHDLLIPLGGLGVPDVCPPGAGYLGYGMV